MLRLRVGKVLQQQGRTAYWLAQEAGLTIPMAYRLAGGAMRRVDLATLGKVADALGVEPGELFERNKERGKRHP